MENNNWIDINDAKDIEINETYLCQYGKRKKQIVAYFDGNYWYEDYTDNCMIDVTHYQSLPKPI